MKIVIMHQTVAQHDAIGNDIELMYYTLKQKYDCKVFAENCFNQHVEYLNETQLVEIIGDSNSLIIYHHSIFWEKGEKYLKKTKGKLIIRYHNITLPEYFLPYSEFHASQCALGRQQTKQLVADYPNAFWMVDSFYNGEDICEIRKDNIGICPPFIKIEQLTTSIPDEEVLRELIYCDKINLFFVGRVVPNKGHFFLLDILKCYCSNYGDDIKLRIIGKFDDGLVSYNRQIEEEINKFGLQDCIKFIGEINDATLISYYLGSDFFLCASDHEGFCVPILEAQYFNLPIIAKASSAIPETIGNGQLLLGENVKEYAAAIHLLSKSNKYKEFLRENGKKNFQDRFTNDQITKIFCGLLRKHLGVIA